MSGRTAIRLVLLGVVIVGAVAVAALLTSRPAPGTEPSASPPPSTAAPSTPTTPGTAASTGTAASNGTASAPATAEASGVVVAVETGGGLDDVRGFTLRVAGGELLVFSLRELQNAAEFAPGHLVQHQVDAYPVRVVYRTEGSEHFALRLEDAPP